ncbi:hypothetical protein ACSBR2_020774 [Camellia fascicularis]
MHPLKMGTLSDTSEIVESMEELDSKWKLDEYAGKRRMPKPGQICSIEDDINQLFEAIDIRTYRRGSGLLKQVGKDNLRKSAMKKPMRTGSALASGIGFSEPVSLKQALRGLCISQASEMAAMKRLSKPEGSSRESEAGTIKKLNRAVEIFLVPEESASNFSDKTSEFGRFPKVELLNQSAHSSTHLPTHGGSEISMAELGQNEKLTHSSSRTHTIEKPMALAEIVPASTEEVLVETDKERNGKLRFDSSLSSGNNASEIVIKSASTSRHIMRPVFRNKIFVKKKIKQDSTSVPSSSNQCSGGVDNDLGPSTSKTVCKGPNCASKYGSNDKDKSSTVSSIVNVSSEVSSSTKPVLNSNFSNRTKTVVSKGDERSRSRDKREFSQSSKSSIGECSSSTSISEESTQIGSSRIGYRPHMSKDLRWEAIRCVQKQHGSLGLRHFKLLKKLGSGDIGTVYLAELIGTNCLFSLKIMNDEFLASKKKMHRAQIGREILQMLDHPFLPTLFAHFTTDKFSCLVMEYCPGGDLHVLQQKQPNKSFSEQAARFYVAEVLLALEYLHMLGVIYRDLKPENIMIREDGHIMLSDFDSSIKCAVNPMLLKSLPVVESPKKDSSPCTESSCIDPFCLQPSWQVPCFTPRLISTASKTRKLKPDLAAQVSPLPQLIAEPIGAQSNSFVGTHEYLAPEIIKGEGHGSAVDWWTFGVFLYELLYGKTPFKGRGNEDTLSNVVSWSLKFPVSPVVSCHTRDLIRGLLVKEPENRLGSAKGAAEIKQHMFFEGLNWALIRCAIPPEVPKSCDFGSVTADLSLQKKEENLEFEMF